MNISQFKRTEVIGRGKFGVVYKAINKQTKQTVAIKVLNLDTQDDEVADVQQEIQFLAELKTVPNVTHYYGSVLNDTKLWIIMDHCAGGSVRTLLKAGVFEERYIAVIVRELLIALQAVHKLGVIHRDLKAANVLITNEGNVQLCDFGVAARIISTSLKRTTMAGTPYWMAPEVIREGDQYNSKADIWSLGITMYEMVTGNPPYCDKDAMWAMQMISKLTPPRLEGREYSLSLKECVALCLDESPDERPSADDLLKCKLVKFYKNYPTSILKEVISRYILWRDHNSSRESVYMNLQDESTSNQESSDHIQVKWDFDSLSSKEYIIENDISLDKLDYDEDHYMNTYDQDTKNDTYITEKGSNNNTIHQSTFKPPTFLQTQSASTSEIPKSLTSLFEENPVESTQTLPATIHNDYEFPSSYLSETHRESPTIEIPDMDNLANFGSKRLSSQLALNKPPTLYHSQSASGNLERSASTSRPRKTTISNTMGSNVSSTSGQSQVTPHTPPYTQSQSNLKTPSPVAPPSSALLNEANLSNTSSPSKSMRALQSNNNPLLQPINLKMSEKTSNGVNTAKPKRDKPSLHIQMPTPSTTFNNLSALTNEEFEEHHETQETVNQFGINPSHVFPTTMTPVTEKQNPHDDDVETRERTESTSSVSSLRYMNQKSKLAAMSGPSTAPANTNTTGLNLFLPRTASLSSTSPFTAPKIAFPTIPNINSEFFSDMTPKDKLTSELDTMIKLFNQGLEALEESV